MYRIFHFSISSTILIEIKMFILFENVIEKHLLIFRIKLNVLYKFSLFSNCDIVYGNWQWYTPRFSAEVHNIELNYSICNNQLRFIQITSYQNKCSIKSVERNLCLIICNKNFEFDNLRMLLYLIISYLLFFFFSCIYTHLFYFI